MLRQTEEDADQEILQLKNKYEWQLRKRQEECTKLKGELGLQTKKASWKHVSVYKTLPPLSFISPPSLPPHITGDQSTGGVQVPHQYSGFQGPLYLGSSQDVLSTPYTILG